MPNITLVSSDSVEFETDMHIAMCSETIKTMLEVLHLEESTEKVVVPVSEVNSTTLRLVLEWFNYHKTSLQPAEEKDKDGFKPISEEEILEWESNFLKVEQKILFALINAANYLQIADLEDAACTVVAGLLKMQPPEKIREILNLDNDIPSEEDERMRREDDWSDEDGTLLNEMF